MVFLYLIFTNPWKKKDFAAARSQFTALLAKYPLDSRAASLQFDMGQMSFDQGQWHDALTDWRRLVAKYPRTDASSAGQFMLGVTLEEKLGQFEEALAE